MDKIFEKQFKKLVSVTELKGILEKIEDPDNVFVGTSGNFGEFHTVERDEFDFIRKSYITPDGNWRNEKRLEITVLDVSFPILLM